MLLERAAAHISAVEIRLTKLERIAYVGMGGLFVLQFLIGIAVAVYLGHH